MRFLWWDLGIFGMAKGAVARLGSLVWLGYCGGGEVGRDVGGE